MFTDVTFLKLFVNETIMAHNIIILQINKLIVKNNETLKLTMVIVTLHKIINYSRPSN